jgi:3-phosphoshikimate 1-carboxyvinyltransferase
MNETNKTKKGRNAVQETISSPRSLKGTLDVPGDKSISHRSLILNALSSGSAVVKGLSSGEDVLSTKKILQDIGVQIEDGITQGEYKITGNHDQFTESSGILDAGNSGTSMRLISGVLASQNIFSVLTGDDSLVTRPMGRVINPLTEMGATILGRNNNSLAPFAIYGGNLTGIKYSMPVASAQVKSCLLIAGLSASTETTLMQPAVSRDHTELMLSAMGCNVKSAGLNLTLEPTKLEAIDVTVPGDISSAAFWIIAALCHPDADLLIRNVGINPSRIGILTALKSMGAESSITLLNNRIEGGEPVADIHVKSCQLNAVELDGDIIPLLIDEVPIIAIAACYAKGTTVIKDAAELKVKESDRIATTVEMITNLGGKIEATDDGMIIEGTGNLSGATCDSYNDHRLAMSASIAGLLASGTTTITNAEAASISYPTFWDQTKTLMNGNI